MCAVLPNIFSLQHNNNYWQVVVFNKVVEVVGENRDIHTHHHVGGHTIESVTAYLYSAFLDTRWVKHCLDSF